VEDVDRFAKKAVAAGLKEIMPIQDQFYGDRSGGFEDPFGHRWSISTHIEDVPPEELPQRMKTWSEKQK
jgi:PhnB protein